jgi:hypothetical protein
MRVKATRSTSLGSSTGTRRSLRMVLAALGAYALLACTLVVASKELTEGCSEGFKKCDADEDGDGTLEPTCVGTNRPEYGCNDTTENGCRPCTLDRAASTCGPDGLCAIAACADGYGDCNDKHSDGCETNVASGSINNCGGCGTRCEQAWPNVLELICADSQCGILSCDPGWKHCNSKKTDGCETPVLADPVNCGNCGVTCDADQTCVEGECTNTPP